MITNQFILPEAIASLADLLHVTIEIRQYAKWYAHESIRLRVSTKKGTPVPAMTVEACQIVNEWNEVSPITPKSLGELIATLEAYAKKTETVSITLAAPVTVSVKKELVSWCRKNISPQILVSFQFNSTLLGGMIVRYGSRVFDWSFKRQLLTNSSAFIEVLRRV